MLDKLIELSSSKWKGKYAAEECELLVKSRDMNS